MQAWGDCRNFTKVFHCILEIDSLEPFPDKFPANMITRIFFIGFFLALHLISLAQVQMGKASFYADKFDGGYTASGQKYRHSKLTAAHKSLPFGTKVRVTNLANNQTVDVVINDRGPYVENRIIDLSKAAAERLGFINQGLTDVKLEVIDAGDGKSKMETVMVDNVAVDEKEFYDFGIKRFNPKGFGVQIGTYQELVNLMRLSDNLKNSYRKKVTVQVKVINGVKYYSLVIGHLSSRSKVQGLLDDVKKKFPDAFIVEFAKLK
jgi:rare lipoprotein A